MELHDQVSRLANALKRQGVRKGDRVCVYMPMTPHAVYAMLACARIGAAHSVVFAGFSAEALRTRILDSVSTAAIAMRSRRTGQCSVVITANEGLRGGKAIHLKRTVDEALLHCPGVKRVLVHQHTRSGLPLRAT